MKKTVTLLAISLSSFATQAQITLSQSSYPATIRGTDSTKSVSNTSVLQAMTTGANKTWDLTPANYMPSWYNQYYFSAPNSIVFTAAHYADSSSNGLSLYMYNVKKVYDIDAGSWQILGEQIKETVYDMSAVTVNTDTIRISAQENAYSMHLPIIKFPATANSKWSSDVSCITNLYIKAPSLSINSPVEIHRRIVSKDTVTGWGTLKIKDRNGINTAPHQVLQIQNTTTYIDSFFTGGLPANPALLTAMSLTQGQSRQKNTRAYYRANEVTPLAIAYYDNNTFANVVDGEVHMQRLAYLSVEDLDKSGNITVYPNPVTGRRFTVQLSDAPAGSWSVDMINITGQVVQRSGLEMNGNRAEVAVSAEIPSGIYYLLLRNNDVVVGRKTLNIQ